MAEQADLLRQLVHELRTPTNAIAGFAEMIESEMLGPVGPAYRGYAGVIRREAADLIEAIDDIDLAARIDARALNLKPGRQSLGPLVARIVDDLQPLTELRGAIVTAQVTPGATVAGDERAVERLVSRLLSTLVSAAETGETIALDATVDERGVALAITLPRAIAAMGDPLGQDEDEPLLGTGFGLRLARNLAVELGGGLRFIADRLTLRLPTASSDTVEQATIN